MVIRPCSTPKLSSSTFTIGTKQFVVQLALEMTLCSAREVVVVDAVDERRVGVVHGADTMTSGAPP